MSRAKYKSVTRARRCPACDGDHKRGIGDDGSIQCGRVPDGLRRGGQHNGHVFLGLSDKDPQFGVFRAADDPVLKQAEEDRRREWKDQRRHRHGKGKTNGTSNGTAHPDEAGADQRPDMEALARRYVPGLTPERAAELAEALGLRIDVLALMPLLGYFRTDPFGACYCLPETDGAGRIIGINRRRADDGKKKAVPDGGRGLTLLNRWDIGGTIFLPEGASDTLSLAALNLTAVGRPSNTGGVAYLAELLRDTPADRDIVLLAEWDANDKGQWPGVDGAKRTAAGLAEALGRPVKWALPPKGAKDVRAWVVAQQLPHDCLDAWHQAGEQLAMMLLEKAHEVKPGPAAVAGPESFTAADLMTMELPEPRFAVEGVVPEGMTVLAGKPKLGKSWMALNLTFAVAEGGVALGNVDVEPGDVLYLALEDTKRRLQGRLRKLLSAQQGTPPARLTLVTRCPRQGAGGLEFLEDWIQSHPNARLIVIDTWPKFRPPKARGRDSYEEDYEHAAQLKALADRHGVAILVIAHCRKMDSEDPVDSVSGTLGLTGAADGVLVLKRERGQADAVLFITGRDIEEQELALRWDARYALWSIAGEAAEYRMGKERTDLLSLLRQEGPLTPSEAAVSLGKTPNAVKMLLRKLEREGWAKGNGGRYAWCRPDTLDTGE